MKNAKRMLHVEQLISTKMMMVDAENYHVAMMSELWNLYMDEGRENLCRNIKNYCDVKNAYEQKEVKNDAVLLVSIKDKSDNVAPAYYFDGNRILHIDNAEIMRDPLTRIYMPLLKKMGKSFLWILISVSVCIGLYRILIAT